MLLTLFAAMALAQAAPEPGAPDAPAAAPAPPAETPIPAKPPHKPAAMDKETCQTKVLSPAEKKSCCKSYPEMCGAADPS